MPKAEIKKIERTDAESKSVDLVAENVARLRGLFPELITEGEAGVSVNVDVLKQLVGDAVVTDADEKYGLNWHGKRAARQLALTPSLGTLRPRPEDSVDWDSTQNLMIEGDNLEVLKLLQKSYTGKVKLIFIDPPYNIGKDFVYPDDYQDNIKNYLMRTGRIESDGRVNESNPDTSGRFHTDWLNMIYPRLRTARDLMCDGGVLFCTIDDNEVCNLRAVLDQVFGSENFVSSICWKKRSSPDARSTIGSVHDWILCYVKNMQVVKTALGKMQLTDERIDDYSNPDNDPRGEWASVDMTGMKGRATSDQYFKVTLPSGRIVEPPEGRSWGIAPKTFEQLRADNRIWFGKTGDNVPRIKKFLKEADGQAVPSFWDYSEVGSNDDATKELRDLFVGASVFDTPKPLRLLRRMLDIGTSPGSHHIVLDFFAGSGTTAHATMLANANDGGHREWILVQLDEGLDPNKKEQREAAEFCDKLKKPRNIAELTKERLRRAGKQVKKDNPNWKGDTGFRVFKLDTSNIKAWDPSTDDVAKDIEQAIDHLKADRTEQDILYELLLKLGLDLCVPTETKVFAGKQVHSIGGGVLMACLDKAIKRSDAEKLALGIAEWHKKLNPAGDTTCVFRDGAFENDVAKTNLAAILNQHGITTVRSI